MHEQNDDFILQYMYMRREKKGEELRACMQREAYVYREINDSPSTDMQQWMRRWRQPHFVILYLCALGKLLLLQQVNVSKSVFRVLLHVIAQEQR